MRTRVWLTSVAMGAAVLAGGATTAQAAPVSAETAAGSCSPVLSPPGGPVYLCSSQLACQKTAEDHGYEFWECRLLSSGWWYLYAWT